MMTMCICAWMTPRLRANTPPTHRARRTPPRTATPPRDASRRTVTTTDDRRPTTDDRRPTRRVDRIRNRSTPRIDRVRGARRMHPRVRTITGGLVHRPTRRVDRIRNRSTPRIDRVRGAGPDGCTHASEPPQGASSIDPHAASIEFAIDRRHASIACTRIRDRGYRDEGVFFVFAARARHSTSRTRPRPTSLRRAHAHAHAHAPALKSSRRLVVSSSRAREASATEDAVRR